MLYKAGKLSAFSTSQDASCGEETAKMAKRLLELPHQFGDRLLHPVCLTAKQPPNYEVVADILRQATWPLSVHVLHDAQAVYSENNGQTHDKIATAAWP